MIFSGCARISKRRIPISSLSSPKMRIIMYRTLPGHMQLRFSLMSYLVIDAVVFDTTHQLSSLDMVLQIWVGLNNYGRPFLFACVLFLFACVLLSVGNQISFAWALQITLHQGKDSLCHYATLLLGSISGWQMAGVSQLHKQGSSLDDTHKLKCVSQGSD